MVNLFRDSMPRPIVGIGHSVGAAQLVWLASIHPRLMSSLISLEGWITLKSPSVLPHLIRTASFRKDTWLSTEEAEKDFKQDPVYRHWDPRALSKMLRYGLRTTPTLLRPHASQGSVTLATPIDQETFSLSRSNMDSVGVDGPTSVEDKTTHPDLPAEDIKHPFYNPWRVQAFHALKSIRSPVLFLYGSRSKIASSAFRDEKLRETGDGPGGSGGTRLGQVEEILIPGFGHYVAMEAPRDTADALCKWLAKQVINFQRTEERLESMRRNKDVAQRQTATDAQRKAAKTWRAEGKTRVSKI